jgi:hypothetical protein
MSEFRDDLTADDIKAIAQLVVYRSPNRTRVIAAIKYLTRMMYNSIEHVYIAKDIDASVMDATLLLLRAMNTVADPPKPKFWQVKRVVRWGLLKALRAV